MRDPKPCVVVERELNKGYPEKAFDNGIKRKADAESWQSLGFRGMLLLPIPRSSTIFPSIPQHQCHSTQNQNMKLKHLIALTVTALAAFILTGCTSLDEDYDTSASPAPTQHHH
ncbi:MAG TPA: hypothetical protein VN673_08465 [Clostridia bacterium]|nr:hypothetical protein [Clostridia bacterium]